MPCEAEKKTFRGMGFLDSQLRYGRLPHSNLHLSHFEDLSTFGAELRFIHTVRGQQPQYQCTRNISFTVDRADVLMPVFVTVSNKGRLFQP